MTTSSKESFSNLAVPPGEMLAEEMEYRDMPREYLATKLGQPVESIDKIIHGEQAITPEIADKLAEVFWIPAWYWLNLEARYRETLAHIAAEESKAHLTAD